MMQREQNRDQSRQPEIALTIAIPTFNRNEILKGTVQKLLPQLNAEVQLLVIDNASDHPVLETLSGLLEESPHANVRVIRNSWNVGADANILRCFELADTEYLWVLGDDDDPLPEAVAVILATIHEHPEGLFYNFASELCRRSDQSSSSSLDTFVASMDSFLNVLFISTSVFRRTGMMQYLQYGYHFAYTMAAHVVILFYAVANDKGSCLLLPSSIVRNTTPTEGTRWSGVMQMLGLGLLLDVPMSRVARRRLAQLVTSPRALEFVTVQLLGYMRAGGERDAARYVMDQVYARLLIYSGRRTIRLRYALYRWGLLLFPAVGLAIFQLMVDVTGRGKEAMKLRDPFRRT